MNQGDAPTAIFPVLPLRNSVLFPRLLMPLVVGRPRSVAAVEAAVASEDKTLVLAAQKQGDADEAGFEDIHHVATKAVVKRMSRQGESLQVLVQGIERVRLVAAAPQENYLAAEVITLPLPADWSTEIEGLHRAVLDGASRLMEYLNAEAQAGLSQTLAQIAEPIQQAYLLGSILSLQLDQQQALLEASSQEAALRLLHDYLTHELQVLDVRRKIASAAQTEMSREQREYVLRQQLKAIHEELGEQTPEQADVTELRRKLDEAGLPDHVRREADRELSRLERMPSAAPDYQLTRTYLELVAELPWCKVSEAVLDLTRTRQILDEDHFNLEKIKDRILEHLAVLKLNPQAKAPILCFAGPPGVGKTSLGQSIARSMGRTFERMSLGGLHDEAELRGHRRTYIGAMPGRIIQAIRRAGVRNPVLMLDEVDKLGHDFRGDPAAALMEILDPAQNADFRDNYLNLPFDLSQVFFICTANTLEAIPRALLDRMEVLRLAGYSDEEKEHIARRYLIPRQLETAGIPPEKWNITDEALRHAIRRYTREAGVRELERTLGTLTRKAAVRFAQGDHAPIQVQVADLRQLLGPERFFLEDARGEFGPGVAAGLAWTEAGGEVLYVEAVNIPHRKDLVLTGQLGDVMKESAQAALSWAAAHHEEFGIPSTAFEQGVHIHVPAGAIPKDGPSAGVTMVSALVSLFTGIPSRSDTAMTGEITLGGLVLPVGGIKEKLLAAHRAGFRRVIIPRQNEHDLDDLPPRVRESLNVVFADRIQDVIAAAVPLPAERLEVP